MLKKYIFPLAAAVCASMLCGCSVDISQGIPMYTGETVGTDKPVTAETVTEPEDDEVLTEESGSSAPMNYGYAVYDGFSEEYSDLISKCVFVGDSICSGFKAYEILPASQVVAQGNVAARNIFDFTFKVGGDERSVLNALVDLRPEYVVFSMGMNDVNITSEDKFCENYGELLSNAETFLPNSKLIVFSVTPVLESSKFTSNENIDGFNAALKEYLDANERWTYVDISTPLKDPETNSLYDEYCGSEDGVHLSPAAYYEILGTLCEAML